VSLRPGCGDASACLKFAHPGEPVAAAIFHFNTRAISRRAQSA
jgi:hypothetical protein